MPSNTPADTQFNILAVESSGDRGGAAVLSGREILSEIQIEAKRVHGQELVPAMERALERASVSREGLSAIVVNHGPGSYTGLRVGQAATETLGYVLGIPVIGVGALEVMCDEMIRSDLATAGCLIPALDARRNQMICAPFFWNGEQLTRTGEDALITPEELPNGGLSRPQEVLTDCRRINPCFSARCVDAAPAQLSPTCLVFGDGSQIYGQRIPEGFQIHRAPLEVRPATVAFAAFRSLPQLLTAPEAIDRKRVELRYFRPVLAQTIAQRAAT